MLSGGHGHEMTHDEIEETKKILEDVSSGATIRPNIGNSAILQRICLRIEQQKQILSRQSETTVVDSVCRLHRGCQTIHYG